MNYIDVNDDMIIASKIIRSYNYLDTDYSEYDRVYPYTTENIEGYLKDSYGKTVLSVAGSGDQYLDLVCKGAKIIDSFDINRLALYYLILKKAAIKSLSKREFYEFMTNDSLKHYNKVRPYLDMNSTKFWDYYVNSFTKYTGIQDTGLFHPRTHGEDYLVRNIYMTDDGYNVLQEKIKSHKLENMYSTDIYSLPNVLRKKYNSIYLSNIIDYQKDREKFKNLVLKLKDFLDTDGELYYGYMYYQKYNNLDYYLTEIPDTIVIDLPGTLKNIAKVDKVLVLKK